MDLPLSPPIDPMLAKLVSELPEADGLRYEPKWDGFRSIVFRCDDEMELSSRNSRPLTRYFPELVESLAAALPDRCVIDGEIVIAGAGGLDFEALLQRIHPAESRIKRLAGETPASFVAFDLLAQDDENLCGLPFAERRSRLEALLPGRGAGDPVQITPQTTDVALAADWLDRFEGAGLDGVVAKSPDLSYQPGKRVMWKIKHERTADCVVAGFRDHKQGGVGSLVLGLYDDQRVLRHVGVCSGFSAKRRHELVDELAPLALGERDTHPWRDAPGSGPTASRWKSDAELELHPLRPTLVCEVAYDHRQGDRFRHATSFRRWRPDRDAESCTFDQLEVVAPIELSEVFDH
ncbi:MAG TPA: ATP-dependent DNA ligase [Acidimicrobiales bacterium]|nr:ATP-dependent DNA ligase [Acidimicrobiales bacterium]